MGELNDEKIHKKVVYSVLSPHSQLPRELNTMSLLYVTGILHYEIYLQTDFLRTFIEYNMLITSLTVLPLLLHTVKA